MDLERHEIGVGNRPALIIVDMINGFTDPACALGCECVDVVNANRELLGAFRHAGFPVYFTTVIYRNPEQAKVFRKRLPALNVLQPGTRWIEIDPAIAPLPGEDVIEKRWASAFFETDLATRLKQAGVDSLVITGLTTSGCVRATVIDGLQYDYPVIVPEEAVGDRNQDAHRANLFDMNAKYADVVSLGDTLAQLETK